MTLEFMMANIWPLLLAFSLFSSTSKYIRPFGLIPLFTVIQYRIPMTVYNVSVLVIVFLLAPAMVRHYWPNRKNDNSDLEEVQ